MTRKVIPSVRELFIATLVGFRAGLAGISVSANDATALGAYYGRVPIYINGTLKYLGVYS